MLSKAEIRNLHWKAAERLRGSVDAMEYKEYILGLIFLKFASDAFEENRSQLRARLVTEGFDVDHLDEVLEDREFTDAQIIWVPRSARWASVAAEADSPGLGEHIDRAMGSIMQANPALKGALPTVFREGSVDPRRLAGVVTIVGSMGVERSRDGSVRDGLAELYAYFLDNFARAEGRRGGEFHTPRSVGRLMVEMLQPYGGRVYDPACGSGGLLVEAGAFMAAQGEDPGGMKIYGQEINRHTWRLARMNLAVHGFMNGTDIRRGDTLADDGHPDLKADFVLAQPPFGLAGRSPREDDPRWAYGVPGAGTHDAWLQHAISKLGERGTACLVLPNGSLSSSGAGRIRRALVEADLVASVVTLPGQLFRSTLIPVCLWTLVKEKPEHRRGQILLVDARDTGMMVDRTERVLGEEDVAKIAGTYHAWRGAGSARQPLRTYRDDPGFCVSADLGKVREQAYALTPGRYVDAAPPVDRPAVPGAGAGALTKDLYGVFT
ncbi:N-6 DNA methylase [Streptomyces sp. NPDC058653]|uniref:type I restriction-modification system subunit M n=1 Tax=Streptomyces sp. NPDC058653 TaxID=3346576 RepID=UPI0036614947